VIRLHAAGWGEGWWRVGGRTWVADGERLWAFGGGCRRLGAVHQVVPDGAGAAVVGRGERGLWRLGTDGRPRAAGELGVGDGFVYADTPTGRRAVDALGPGEHAWIGGGGVVVVEGPDGLRVGLPGRTPRRVAAVARGVRVDEDGSAVAWVDDEAARGVVLATGERYPLDGWPVTARAAFADGVVRRGALRWARSGLEGSAARAGTLLAGPGGRVWDLGRARPVTAPGTVLPGATVAVGTTFVTVDALTGAGHHVGPDGVSAPFRLPLEDDDVVTEGWSRDGAAAFVTALGVTFVVEPAGAREASLTAPPRRRPATVTTAWGPFRGASTAEVDGAAWLWNDAGWLVSWPIGSGPEPAP
jgi:hypothetical protein